MEKLTEREKEFLKYLLRISLTMTNSDTIFGVRNNENFDKFYDSDVFNLASKLGIYL